MEAGVNLKRRNVLKTGGGFGPFGLLAAACLVRTEVALADWLKAAFEAKTISALVPENSSAIQITTPDVAADGAVVPVTVESSLSRTEQISILVDKNPTMLAASFVIPEGTEGYLTARIKMAQTAAVIALMKVNGKFYRASKEVKVTKGGLLMSAPTKIRATAKDGITEVRALMQHEMENGRRKDEADNLVPAWCIIEIKARHNGRIALKGRFGTSVSKPLSGVPLQWRGDGRQNRAFLAGQSGLYAFRRGGNKLMGSH